MTKGLILTALLPSGTNRYSTGKALLDVSGISDPYSAPSGRPGA